MIDEKNIIYELIKKSTGNDSNSRFMADVIQIYAKSTGQEIDYIATINNFSKEKEKYRIGTPILSTDGVNIALVSISDNNPQSYKYADCIIGDGNHQFSLRFNDSYWPQIRGEIFFQQTDSILRFSEHIFDEKMFSIGTIEYYNKDSVQQMRSLNAFDSKSNYMDYYVQPDTVYDYEDKEEFLNEFRNAVTKANAIPAKRM